MKYVIPVLVAATVFMGCGSAFSPQKEGAADKSAQKDSVKWLTDFEKAKKKAAELNRPILADFSGSDWCGWCIRLEDEVFSKKTFQEFAEDNLVLFLADFPRSKKQPAALKQQNERLAGEYGIRGFPTVLLLDADGKVVARTGYQRGGPDAYIEHLKDIADDALPREDSMDG